MTDDASKLKRSLDNKTLKTDVSKRYVHERPKPEGTAPSSRPTQEDNKPSQSETTETSNQDQPAQSSSDNQSED